METVETAVPTVSTAFTAATDSKTKTTDKRVEASSLAARPSTKQHQSSFTAGATNVADHQLAAGFPPFLTAVHTGENLAQGDDSATGRRPEKADDTRRSRQLHEIKTRCVHAG